MERLTDLWNNGAEYVLGTTKFSERFRSLEIEVHNKTNSILHLKSTHFEEGEWFTYPLPRDIKPGQKSFGRVANRQATMEGVKGGVEFEIGSTGMNFYIGFENPFKGDYKSFIAVDRNESAKWACEKNSEGSSKTLRGRGYSLSCSPQNPTESEFKKFVFTIKKDTLNIKITNTTPYDLCYKNKFVEPESTLVKPCTIAANKTETIVLTHSSGCLGKVAGGFKYTLLKGQKLILYIGFRKTTVKSLGTFIDIKNDKTAEWACKKAVIKRQTKKNRGYTLLASTDYKKQTFYYTIKNVLFTDSQKLRPRQRCLPRQKRRVSKRGRERCRTG